MLYLGIDQHHEQLTISLRDGEGTVILKRQVSTRPEKTQAFLDDVCRRGGVYGGARSLRLQRLADQIVERISSRWLVDSRVAHALYGTTKT